MFGRSGRPPPTVHNGGYRKCVHRRLQNNAWEISVGGRILFRLGASRGAGPCIKPLCYNGAAGAESGNLFSGAQPPEAYHLRNMNSSPFWAKCRAMQRKRGVRGPGDVVPPPFLPPLYKNAVQCHEDKGLSAVAVQNNASEQSSRGN